ncbi:MAG: type III secretion system chaperone [Pseudomonadota bacterium]
MNDETLEKFLGELGALNPTIQAISRGEDPSSWYISMGEDDEAETIAVGVYHREEERKLVLIAGLVVPDEQNEHATYEALLTFNSLWTETSGQRMALDEDGLPTLLMDITLPGLTAEALSEAVEEFAIRALSWAFMLMDGGVSEAEEPQDAEVEQTTPENVLRV